MEQLEHLASFFKAITTDPRIGVSHISLYCALLQNCTTVEDEVVIPIIKSEMAQQAKISPRTFLKCIKDLHDFGYLRYKPSYNFRKKSKVQLYLTTTNKLSKSQI